MKEIIKCKCGIVGIWNRNTNTIDIRNILEQLQHRGRESVGITYLDKDRKSLKSIKGVGMVKDVFKNKLDITSSGIIGHVRYSTSGNSKLSYDDSLKETQPFVSSSFALAHNGNIPDTFIKKYCNSIGEIENNNNDSQVLVNFINKHLANDNWLYVLQSLVSHFKYAYCLTILTHNKLFVLRDIFGYRPLSLGVDENNNYIVASENVAFINYTKIRDILPGECVQIDNNGVSQLFHEIHNNNIQKCIFEYVYFMKPESTADGNNVYQNRFEMGKILAKEEKLLSSNGDYIVIGSPNTGIPGGKGYASQMGFKYVQALRKKKDCGRTFILPSQEARLKFLTKFILDIDDIKGKKVILVDDSIVRGNTIKALSRFFKEDGMVKEFHMRVVSPPVKNPCFYGIDIPTKEELIANKHSVDEITEISGLDSLQYISIDGMKSIYGNDKNNFCDACFSGNYNEMF